MQIMNFHSLMNTNRLHFIVLYCIVLYCIVLYCISFLVLHQLNLQQKQESVDLSQFVSNSEMDLIAATLSHDTVSYDIFSGMYRQIIMELHIRRKPLYYLYTVIAPTLVLCILTLSSFLLPCDNGEKVGIGLTVFLSLYVLQLAVAENIPESNSLPLLGTLEAELK